MFSYIIWLPIRATTFKFFEYASSSILLLSGSCVVLRLIHELFACFAHKYKQPNHYHRLNLMLNLIDLRWVEPVYQYITIPKYYYYYYYHDHIIKATKYE